MSGGLSIPFYGNACRRAGLGGEHLDRPEVDLAGRVLVLLEQEDVRQVGVSHTGHPFHDHVQLLRRAVHLVALEHADSDHFDVLGGEEFDELDDYSWRRNLSDELGSRAVLLMDFLCVYLHQHDTRDMAMWFRLPEGDSRADNCARKDTVLGRLNGLLSPRGYVVLRNGEVLPSTLAGTRPSVERPAYAALDGAGWREVADRLKDAEAELEAGKPADALTDVSTALQFALEGAGFSGNTLGEQLRAARRGGLFDGLDCLLGDALDSIATWISGVRNTRSDAHANPPPSEVQAVLAMRLAAVFAAWLADRHVGAQS